jgi:predicted metal-binding membrane protein
MALLFIGGAMNVLWIALITIFVFAEKIIPAGRFISRIAGVGFVLMGTWLIANSF